MIEDFYPINQWTPVEPKRWVIDETTQKRYPYYSENNVRIVAGCSTLVTPLLHVVGLVANVGLRIIRLLSFWHFWKNQTEQTPFKARLQEAGMDLLKIVAHPFAILALELVSFYGIFRPYDAMKLYCSIEEFQYDRYLLTSLLSMNPEDKPPSSVDTEPPKEEPLKPLNTPTPIENPTLDSQQPPLKTPDISTLPQDPPPIVIPDITKKIEDKIDKLVKLPIPNLSQMKGETVDLIIDHIIEYSHPNPSEVIKTSLETIKNKLIVHKFFKEEQATQRLNGLKWTEDFIIDALVRKLFIESIEKDNLEPLMILKVPDNKNLLIKFKLLLSFEELQATAVKCEPTDIEKLEKLHTNLKKRALILNQLPDCIEEFKPSFVNFANIIQEKYVENFGNIQDHFRKTSPDSTSSSELDEAESDEDRPTQIQENNHLTKLLNASDKLNEFLLLFMDEPLAKYYGMEILQQTLTKLFKVKLDLELFTKVAHTHTKNLNSHKGIASAIVSAGEYLKNLREGLEDSTLENFNICCQIILQSLNYTEHQKSIKNPQDLFHYRYILFLTLIFQDAFMSAEKTLSSVDIVRDISVSSLGKNVVDIQGHLDKINILLETEFKVEISKPQDDRLVALIFSIPNVLPSDPIDIQNWLETKSVAEKENFSNWLERKAQTNFAIFAVHNPAHLEVIYQMCLAKI